VTVRTRWGRAADSVGFASKADNPALCHAWTEWIGHLPWGHSLTLTVAPRRGAARKRLVESETRRFIDDVERIVHRPVGWFYGFERSPRGDWHAHALLTDDVPEEVVAAVAEVWRLRNGRIDIVRVWDGCGAVVYATKEAARDGDVHLSRHLGRYRDRLSDDFVVKLVDGEGS
jgi:hypothetical protein